MSSLGWYLLGYIGLGMVVWIGGVIGIVTYAVIKDIRYDMKNDPTMKRADNLDSIVEICREANSHTFDAYQITENEDWRKPFLRDATKALLLWPYMVPKGCTYILRAAMERAKQKQE